MSGSREGLVSAFANFSGGRDLNVVHCSGEEGTRDRRGSIKRQGPQEVRCEEIQHSKQGHLFPCTRRMVAKVKGILSRLPFLRSRAQSRVLRGVREVARSKTGGE